MADYSESFGADMIDFYKLTPRVPRDREFENIYELPLQATYRDEDKKLRICQFGHPSPSSKAINILVIGSTGSGKSTAVNAVINYLANVQFEDDHRLEIVSLENCEMARKGIQTESQTDWITVYEISQFGDVKQDCQVNIVDTPGFGDTRGKERDEETLDQIRHLFKHYLTTVNAVCITMHGTETRSHDRQRYIFDSIMKVFGKDIQNNLYIWATFTDDENPPVLGGLKKHGIQFQDHFSFENGALFREVSDEPKDRKKYKGKFEDVYKTFDQFFNKIKNAPPQSLENSQQVLEERNKLRNYKAMIEVDIKKTLQCLENQKKFKRDVIESGETVSASWDCSFYVTVSERCAGKVYNCEHCKTTCCDPCNHNSFPRFFYECSKLGRGGYCKTCRCHSSRHQPSTSRRYAIKKKTLAEIEVLRMNSDTALILDEKTNKLIDRAKYFVAFARKDKQKKKEVLDNTRTEIIQLKNHLFESLMNLNKALKNLQKIALYEEKTSVTEILNEIESLDANKNDPEVSQIYHKLKDYIHLNNL